MKILFVNNRLKVFGGEGTYMVSVGDYLQSCGHDVQYFGLEDPDGKHGNRFGIYAKKSKTPFSIKKNANNAKRFGKLLDLFKPDIIHINLVYFTLTPSILTEAKKRHIPIVQTVHDGKIVCPSYQLFVVNKKRACDLCSDGNFKRCFDNKCVKNSKLLSYLAFREAVFNKKLGFYDLIDRFVFPSHYMEKLHVSFGIPETKCLYLQNFSRIQPNTSVSKEKSNYVLFFGRLEIIKGVEVLIEAIKKMPNIKFVIAGSGSSEYLFNGLPNCELLGFVSGDKLKQIISNARVSVFPSIWNENCPMGIAESISLGTPVIGARIGGIPELIQENATGFLVDPGSAEQLIEAINECFQEDIYSKMALNCIESSSITSVDSYCDSLLHIYCDLIKEYNNG